VKTKEFLKELSELTRKYRIAIGGCGCCGSPFLISFDEREGEYDNPDFEYTLLDEEYELSWSDPNEKDSY